MKTTTCFIGTLLLTVSMGGGGLLAAQTVVPPALVAVGVQKTGAGKNGTAAPGAKQPGAAEEAPAKIEGIVLNRPDGGFLGLTLVDHKFKLSFYDAKKKPAKVDVARATARWPVRYSIYDERTVLNPNEDGTALTSPKYVRPPYSFKLYLTLIPLEEGQQVESYVIDFHE
jgi:hypothetical protein